MLSIPIMTLRLLDLQLPRKQYAEINFIGAAKDLLRDHRERTEAAGIDLELFHNKDIKYSSIQLDRYQGSPEWTAYGEEAVETLWFWLALYRERNPALLKNSVVIQEHYTPDFCSFEKGYRIDRIILSKTAIKNLQRIRDKEKQDLLLKNYVYGNILRFLTHIGYHFDKDHHFLAVKIHKCVPKNTKNSVFKEQRKQVFQLSFSCNFRLPQTLRLGQSTALGYGKITHHLSREKKVKNDIKLMSNFKK